MAWSHQRLPPERATTVMGQSLIGARRTAGRGSGEDDLRKLNLRNWRKVAMDRQAWKGVVKEALGLQGP
ncbi:hypothetical protein QE152_g22357 [Popillia japonica]|uniref:Uncharacterized protein n=1 Tax=Popillia japonica TaxID=7064 RepID=A0AAW1KLB4_POPJA